MKASELRGKDAAGLNRSSELLKAQFSLRMQRPPNSCRTPAS